MLHGAGQSSSGVLDSPLPSLADEVGFLLLVPDSRGGTWDLIGRRRFGPDVAFLDRVLGQVFARHAVDATRVALAGFSDGASYALSLGPANGDLFSHLIAFSPGFASPPARRGSPRIYVSHGTRDQILPIETCSRRLVPRLQADGYDVLYREFDGPHGIPPEIAREAVLRFAGPAA
jgi:phospholipase/carboxylesterase